MKLLERIKRWRRGILSEPKQELPGQCYFVVIGTSFSFDTGKPMYVRGAISGDQQIKVTTDELRRAGLKIDITANDTEWIYVPPYDSIAEISWETFKTMRKLGD